MRRICILDDELLRLEPVRLRLWLGFILCIVGVTCAATSCGMYSVMRRDYAEFNRVIDALIEQRDGLMTVCVAQDERTKKMAKVRTKQLGMGGGEER